MHPDELYKRIEASGLEGIRRIDLKKEFDISMIDDLISKGMVFVERKRGGITYWSRDNYIQYLLSSDPKFKLLVSCVNSQSSVMPTIDKLSNIISDIDERFERIKNEVAEIKEKSEKVVKFDLVKDIDARLSSGLSELNNKVESLRERINTIDNSKLEFDSKLDTQSIEFNKKLSEIRSAFNTLERLVYDLEARVDNAKKEMEEKTISMIVERIANGNGNHTENISLEQFKMEFDRTIAESATAIGWIELSKIRERICSKYRLSKDLFYSLAAQLIDAYSNHYEISSGGSEGVMIRGLIHGFVRRI